MPPRKCSFWITEYHGDGINIPEIFERGDSNVKKQCHALYCPSCSIARLKSKVGRCEYKKRTVKEWQQVRAEFAASVKEYTERSNDKMREVRTELVQQTAPRIMQHKYTVYTNDELVTADRFVHPAHAAYINPDYTADTAHERVVKLSVLFTRQLFTALDKWIVVRIDHVDWGLTQLDNLWTSLKAPERWVRDKEALHDVLKSMADFHGVAYHSYIMATTMYHDPHLAELWPNKPDSKLDDPMPKRPAWMQPERQQEDDEQRQEQHEEGEAATPASSEECADEFSKMEIDPDFDPDPELEEEVMIIESKCTDTGAGSAEPSNTVEKLVERWQDDVSAEMDKMTSAELEIIDKIVAGPGESPPPPPSAVEPMQSEPDPVPEPEPVTEAVETISEDTKRELQQMWSDYPSRRLIAAKEFVKRIRATMRDLKVRYNNDKHINMFHVRFHHAHARSVGLFVPLGDPSSGPLTMDESEDIFNLLSVAKEDDPSLEPELNQMFEEICAASTKESLWGSVPVFGPEREPVSSEPAPALEPEPEPEPEPVTAPAPEPEPEPAPVRNYGFDDYDGSGDVVCSPPPVMDMPEFTPMEQDKEDAPEPAPAPASPIIYKPIRQSKNNQRKEEWRRKQWGPYYELLKNCGERVRREATQLYAAWSSRINNPENTIITYEGWTVSVSVLIDQLKAEAAEQQHQQQQSSSKNIITKNIQREDWFRLTQEIAPMPDLDKDFPWPEELRTEPPKIPDGLYKTDKALADKMWHDRQVYFTAIEAYNREFAECYSLMIQPPSWLLKQYDRAVWMLMLTSKFDPTPRGLEQQQLLYKKNPQQRRFGSRWHLRHDISNSLEYHDWRKYCWLHNPEALHMFDLPPPDHFRAAITDEMLTDFNCGGYPEMSVEVETESSGHDEARVLRWWSWSNEQHELFLRAYQVCEIITVESIYVLMKHIRSQSFPNYKPDWDYTRPYLFIQARTNEYRTIFYHIEALERMHAGTGGSKAPPHTLDTRYTDNPSYIGQAYYEWTDNMCRFMAWCADYFAKPRARQVRLLARSVMNRRSFAYLTKAERARIDLFDERAFDVFIAYYFCSKLENIKTLPRKHGFSHGRNQANQLVDLNVLCPYSVDWKAVIALPFTALSPNTRFLCSEGYDRWEKIDKYKERNVHANDIYYQWVVVSNGPHEGRPPKIKHYEVNFKVFR